MFSHPILKRYMQSSFITYLSQICSQINASDLSLLSDLANKKMIDLLVFAFLYFLLISTCQTKYKHFLSRKLDMLFYLFYATPIKLWKILKGLKVNRFTASV